MGRTEGLRYHPTAGLDLLEQIRKQDKAIVFVIYSSALAGQNYGRQALELGATAVTSSPTELFGILNLGSKQKHAASA